MVRYGRKRLALLGPRGSGLVGSFCRMIRAHRRGLTSFLDLASGAVLLGIFHVVFLTVRAAAHYHGAMARRSEPSL
jgi:hypothetical protein